MPCESRENRTERILSWTALGAFLLICMLGGGDAIAISSLDKVEINGCKLGLTKIITDHAAKGYVCIDSTTPTIGPGGRDEPNGSGDVAGSQSSGASGQGNTSTTNKCAGNPVMIASGNKVEFEVDLELPGRMPLRLERTFNYNSAVTGLFGRGWVTSLDRRALFEGDRANPDKIKLVRADGSTLDFLPDINQSARWLMTPEDGLPTSQLRFIERVSTSPLRYRYHLADGTKELYAGGGSLLQVMSPGGVSWTLEYSNPEFETAPAIANSTLMRMRHSNGRMLQFNWTTSNLARVVNQVLDPAGAAIQYQYDNERLAKVVYPPTPHSTQSGPVLSSDYIDYHYASTYSPILTGKSVNGQRYSYFTYNSDGRVSVSEHAGGVDRHTFQYSGNTTVVTDPYGRRTTYSFDVRSSPLLESSEATSTCPAAVTSYSRDSSGLQLTTTLPGGVEMRSTVDGEGYVQSEVVGVGTSAAQLTEYEWAGSPRRLVRQRTPHQERLFSYDSLGRVTSQSVGAKSGLSSASGTWTETTAYVDWPSGLPQTISFDGRLPGSGDAVVSHFNANGDLVAVDTSIGRTNYELHDAYGRPRRITGPNGVSTDLEYDARGRLVAQSIAGKTWRWAFTGDSQLLEQQGPDGLRVTTRFDQALRPVESRVIDNYQAALYGSVSPGVHRLTRELDAAGNQTKLQHWSDLYLTVSGGEGSCEPNAEECWHQPATISYWDSQLRLQSLVDRDHAGQVSAVRGNNGQLTSFVRAADGLATSRRTAAEGGITHTETYEYDALRRIQRTNHAGGGFTEYEFNAENQLIRVRDPKGGNTHYTRDALGLVTQLSSPDTGSTTFSYHPGGLLASENRADGTNLSYSYLSDGRLQQISSSRGGQTLSRTYAYDACTNGAGRLCSVTESNGEAVAFSYTPLGQLASQASTIAGQTLTVQWTYNAGGQIDTITYPSGLKVLATSADGRARTLTVQAGGASKVVVDQAAYLPFGPVSSFIDAVGVERQIARDLDGRTVGIQGSGYLGIGYNIRNLVTAISGVGMSGLSYDAEGRLTAATESGASSSFGFDLNGNRVTANYSGSANATHQLDAGSNRLASISKAGDNRYFIRDAAGNLVSDQRSGITDCHAYDAFMRLASFNRYGGSVNCGSPGASATSTASYRFNGFNQRSFKSANGLSTRYVYGLDGELLYEIASDGRVRHYVWLDGQLVAMNDNAGSAGATHAVYSDHLGRPFKVVDSAGTTRWTAQLKAFDRTVTGDSLGGFNIGFPGQYFDAESGLWQNWHRTYDASLGRYTQSDLIGLQGGTNTYVYVNGNPISGIDPYGLFCISPKAKSSITGALSSAASALVATRGNLLATAAFGVAGGIAGYQTGDAGGGAIVGFLSAAFSGPSGFSPASGLVGGVTGALAGEEGTVLGGALGGAAGSAMNANRGVRVLNPNSFYGSGFGQTLKGGLIGAVGGLVNELAGGLVDSVNNKFGDCGCGK